MMNALMYTSLFLSLYSTGLSPKAWKFRDSRMNLCDCILSFDLQMYVQKVKCFVIFHYLETDTYDNVNYYNKYGVFAIFSWIHIFQIITTYCNKHLKTSFSTKRDKENFPTVSSSSWHFFWICGNSAK